MDASTVVSVLGRVGEDSGSWEAVAAETRGLLDNGTPVSTLLHAAAVLGTPPTFVSLLGLDPQTVATYSTALVEDSAVARKQYQRVIGEHTRVQTYDMLTESVEGYARLLQVLSTPPRKARHRTDSPLLGTPSSTPSGTQEPADDELMAPASSLALESRVRSLESTWASALGLIGRFGLEPFKVLALWIVVLLDSPAEFEPFALWARTSVWNKHADWAAVLQLVGQWDLLAKLAATLVVHGVVPFAKVYALLDPLDAGYAKFEASWSTQKAPEVNALTMAMPLVDDDEEDEDLMAAETEGEHAGHNSAVHEPATEPEDDMKVHHLMHVVGEILNLLASVDAPEVEPAVLSVVYAHALTFGTSREVAQGLSNLIAARLPRHGLAAVTPLIMPHFVLEPAWSALNAEADVAFFRKYLLPSIDLHPATQPHLWSLPAIERYALYTDLTARVATTNEFVKSRFAGAEKDTKDLLKRLTKQDAESLIVPQLLDVFARCPWPSLNVFVNQVESYNIGQLVARSSAADIAPLAMDMLPLILMQQFTAQGRVTRRQDGLFHEKWFKLLAQFAGDVAVAYEGFDFVVLIKLVLQQFSTGDFSQLVVLAQLVFRLTGLPPLANLSVPQLLALHAAEPVSSLAAAVLSEQYNPQRERLVEGLREAGLTVEVFAALAYAYGQTAGAAKVGHEPLRSEDGANAEGTEGASSEGANSEGAKVVAGQLDDLANVALTYASLFDTPLLDADAREHALESGMPAELANAASRSRQGPFEFWNLRLYDIVLEPDLYTTFGELADSKAVERATLSHRLRVKSVKQQAAAAPKPELAEMLARLVMSPADALYTSRFIQDLMPDHAQALLAREVVLSVLQSATPLETESYALFVADMLAWCYAQPDVDVRESHDALTSAVLDAAYPDAAYPPLANTFAFLQRTLFVFPAFEEHGSAIIRRVRLLITAMQGDLQTAVKSLSPQLDRCSRYWQPATTPPARAPTKELCAEIKQNNERLMARLVAGVKRLPKNDSSEPAELAEPTEQPKRFRRQRRPRERRWKR